MRIYIFDQYEFGDGGGEENLVFSQSHVNNFSSLLMFYEATTKNGHFLSSIVKTLPAEKRVDDLENSSPLVSYLRQYCNVEFPHNQMVCVLDERWNLNDYVFKFKHYYMRYQWSTSA